ncbi:unnamed protein product [Durusdinium trenchii]|uniref:CCHC-type domain-containing protein n=1 Tax=Durusdinium trenchii TaxID=1381693 RepID=A0ABP0J2W3_9DINO
MRLGAQDATYAAFKAFVSKLIADAAKEVRVGMDGTPTGGDSLGWQVDKFCTEFDEKLRRLQAHGVKLPTTVQGWFLLKKANVTREQRQLVLTHAPGLERNKVQEALYLFLGQDHKAAVVPERRPFGRGKGHKAFVAEEGWDDLDEAFYQEDHGWEDDYEALAIESWQDDDFGFDQEAGYYQYDNEHEDEEEGKAPDPKARSFAAIQCLRCGASGHMAANCPKKGTSTSSSPSAVNSPAKRQHTEGMAANTTPIDEHGHVIFEDLQGRQRVDCTMIDPGASAFLMGTGPFERYIQHLQELQYPVDDIQMTSIKRVFHFGGDHSVSCHWKARLPVFFNHNYGYVTGFVISGETPMLMGRPILEALGLALNFQKKLLMWEDSPWQDITIGRHGEYLLPLTADFQPDMLTRPPAFDLVLADSALHEDVEPFTVDFKTYKSQEGVSQDAGQTPVAEGSRKIVLKDWKRIDHALNHTERQLQAMTQLLRCAPHHLRPALEKETDTLINGIQEAKKAMSELKSRGVTRLLDLNVANRRRIEDLESEEEEMEQEMEEEEEDLQPPVQRRRLEAPIGSPQAVAPALNDATQPAPDDEPIQSEPDLEYAQASSAAADNVEFIVRFWNELFNPQLELKSNLARSESSLQPVLITDAKALYDTYHRDAFNHGSNDKRTALEVKVTRQQVESFGGRLKWVSSERQYGDGLTKLSARQLLADRLRHGSIKYTWDPTYTAAKKKPLESSMPPSHGRALFALLLMSALPPACAADGDEKPPHLGWLWWLVMVFVAAASCFLGHWLTRRRNTPIVKNLTDSLREAVKLRDEALDSMILYRQRAIENQKAAREQRIANELVLQELDQARSELQELRQQRRQSGPPLTPQEEADRRIAAESHYRETLLDAKGLLQRCWREMVEHVGWEKKASDGHLDGLLRDDPEAMAEAKRRFDAFMAGDASLLPDDIKELFGQTMKTKIGSSKEYQALRNLQAKATTNIERKHVYVTIGHTADIALKKDVLDWVSSKNWTNGEIFVEAKMSLSVSCKMLRDCKYLVVSGDIKIQDRWGTEASVRLGSAWECGEKRMNEVDTWGLR